MRRLIKHRPTQDGLASIVIVTVLVVLITLITIGFARIMTRSSNNALNDQLSTAATYAAQSGINDAIAYLKDNPAASASGCSDLIGSSATPGPLYGQSNLSGDEARTTEYTCVLINKTPTDVVYQQLPPLKSQVAKLTTSGAADKLMFSWQSTDRSKDQLLPPSANSPLRDATHWNNQNYVPLLRLSLYPIPSDGQVGGVQANSKTFFFYPTSAGGNVTTLPYSTADGSLQNINCGTKNAPSFTGTADYDCNVIISGLASAALPASLGYFYARLTPVYGQADIKIKAENTAGVPLQFVGTQAVLDVTARASSTAKRLQVRVDTSAASGGITENIGPTEETIPEYAVRTAASLCKRLNVDAASSIDSAFCNLTLPPPPPPIASTGSATDITTTSATLNGTVNPNAYPVTGCYFQYGTSPSYGSRKDCAQPPASLGSGRNPVNINAGLGSLNPATTYQFQLCAENANPNGRHCGDNASFTTLTPPPNFSFGADDRSIAWNSSTTLRWSTNWVTWCWASDAWSGWKNPSGGSESTGSLTSSQTYTLKCGRTGIEADAQTVRINVAPQPPPGVATFDHIGQSGSSLRFRYACTNSSSASITVNPNRTGGGEGTQPLGSTSGESPVGGPYQPGDSGWARLNCSRGGEIATRTINWSIPRANINVRFSDPNDIFGVQGYDFTFRTTVRPEAPNDCRDGIHTFVACFDLTVDQDGNRERISHCDLSPGGRINNDFGQRHWSGQGRWIFHTLGWSSYPGDQTISATCYSKDGGVDPRSSSIRVHWRTCEDRGQTGEYGTDVARNGCRDKESDPPPTSDPPGDGDGGGGNCCGGTPPPGGDPPPPYDPCAFNNRRLLYPNFGFINLPSLYFGLWFC